MENTAFDTVLSGMPLKMRSRVESAVEAVNILTEIGNPKVVAGMLPSAGRGLLLRKGKQGGPVMMKSGHSAYFDFTYKSDFPEMLTLYELAKEKQWNATTDLDWNTSVDPLNPEVPLIPESFFPSAEDLGNEGVHLSGAERQKFKHSVTAWMLSQFLHGEQGALFAAAQVTESVQWMDGKFYGATQVMDEGRHVEVFHRYLSTKMQKLYQINDNLFVIIDSLMTDSRWDMKFLGMQIMVEGLALGAFSTLYRGTSEPLLKELLKYVIRDEARHVHYGVLALREHFAHGINEKERQEREDWSFEVALLMRNRFMAHEIYDEWFSGHFSRRKWNLMVTKAPGMQEFRRLMFARLIPNLRAVGLLSPRIQKHYERVGLLHFASGKDASQLTSQDLLGDLDVNRPGDTAVRN